MPPKETTDTTSYKNLVDLMAIHADATGRLAAMEIELQEEFLKLVDERRKEFARLQGILGESQTSIETLATINPQWFEKKKTLKTPYGSVSFRKTSKLNVKNEEVTIVLIEQRGDQDKAAYLREKKELNLEALEKLDDAELKALRIVRETTESCKVTAAKIDLGKAVAKSTEDGKAA
ncbi:host-nuclease inhibitor Gam family protein [Luteolibacter marinus]|uniref:host-nuclease inhibitor Gam family protein n=1 Tax=Luteolibacter marinus TaxID=2776705 RepID=UPI0018676A77|nr:host-nuclease inhibitor Gam family protein [Luteolibacter marinus]